MEGSRMIWLQARIRDEPYNPELGATTGSAGKDPILPISLGMVPEDHTVNDLAGLIVKRFDTVHPDKGRVKNMLCRGPKLRVRYLQTEYGALMSVLDPVGMHFPRRNGQEPERPFTVLAIRFPPLPDELQHAARFTSVAPESSARPYKRSRDELQRSATLNRYGLMHMHHENTFTNKRQRISNSREGTIDPDRPIRSRERDLPTIDADTYPSTRQNASNYMIADSQQSPHRTHIITYGTPNSLSTASINATAFRRPQDPASVPDSPNYRGGSPMTRMLQDENIPLDAPKSESPEQDNIVYSIPPSHPSTSREQTVSRTEELTAAFMKPSLPVAGTKTPIREIPSAVLSSKKEMFANPSKPPDGPRLETPGKCMPIAQNGLGVLTSAISNGSKAFSSRKPPPDVYDVPESDEEGSWRRDRVHIPKTSKQQRPTAVTPLSGPRFFSRFNGPAIRSSSVNRSDSENAESRRGSTTNLPNIEDFDPNCSLSKISARAPDDVPITENTVQPAMYPFVEETIREDPPPSERNDTQPTRFVVGSLRGNSSNDQGMVDKTTSKHENETAAELIKPTVEHGIDIDMEMTLSNGNQQSDTKSPDQALNVEDINDEHEAVSNGRQATVETSDVAKTTTVEQTPKQTQSMKEIAHNASHKEAKEVSAAQRKTKKAHQNEIEKKERIRKARELEEQRKRDVSIQNEKRCIGTPAAATFRQKSITSPIPGSNPRRSVLKSSTALRSSSISAYGTPSRGINVDTQSLFSGAMSPSPALASRSVSFADPEITESKASGDSKPSRIDASKGKKSQEEAPKAAIIATEPIKIKEKPQEYYGTLRDHLRARKAAAEHERRELAGSIELKTKAVNAKTGKTKPGAIQMELQVIRDKGKKPVYDPPSPPKPIVSHLPKEVEMDEDNISSTPLPHLGNQPGPSKSRSTSASVSSKERNRMLEKEPTMLKEAPRMDQTPNLGRISEGVEAAGHSAIDDPLLSKSVSRSPAREVISSGSSRSESDSGSGSQSDSESEDVSCEERNVTSSSLNSEIGRTKVTHQAMMASVSRGEKVSSESETDSDDGKLPTMKSQSRTTKSPVQSDSETTDKDEDENDQLARRSVSTRDGTASRSTSIVDEAEQQLQRENRQSMEPSHSSQMYPPRKTARMAGLPVVAQQERTTNLLSTGTRLPNQRMHSLSSIMKSTSTPTVTAGKKPPAHKLSSMKTADNLGSRAGIYSLPVPTPKGSADSRSSSEDEDEDEDDDDDDDDMDDGNKGSASKGFVGVLKLGRQMYA
ncbi:hypothetical protein MMC26_006247 [Xylographa opegraphella]|nr:hypothetical protein [Xylographa opegraphella]